MCAEGIVKSLIYQEKEKHTNFLKKNVFVQIPETMHQKRSCNQRKNFVHFHNY